MYLGRLKIFGLSLGLSFVFFTGIVASHLGITVDEEILSFVLNFGLILFVYTLGIQVGPSFIASFKTKGLILNLWALVVIFCSILCVALISFFSDVSVPALMGILSGAVTNIPALGAAQESVSSIISNNPSMGSVKDVLALMTMATAITYPFGVVGVFLVLHLLKAITPYKIFIAQDKKVKTDQSEFLAVNKAIIGMSVSEIMEIFDLPMVISQIWRKGEFIIPKSETIIEADDHVLVVSEENLHDKVKLFFGDEVEKENQEEEEIDWEHSNDSYTSKKIVITQAEYNGVRMGSLDLRNKMGINVTAVARAGMDLLPSPNLRLQLGDRISVVGKEGDVNNLSKKMGNELKKLDTPYLVTLFIGMLMGCAIGAIPIFVPGLSAPIKMGLAGGPLIMGILMGVYGPRFHLATYITQSANLLIRTFGIVLFMAALGLSSGAHFVETLNSGPGFLWLGIGAFITAVPPLIIGILCIRLFKLSYSHTAGVVCGSMANPVAMEYAVSLTGNDTVAVSYVTVYPLTMIVRVIVAQLTVAFLML